MLRFFPYLFFVCLGFTCEIFFVALSNLYLNEPLCNESLWALTGKTYLWMAPLYAIIPFGFGIVYPKIKHLHLFLRLLICVIFIYALEFLSGWGLAHLVGKCPWEYTTGWHLAGYIRLDYFPAWFLFAYIIEYLFLFLQKIKLE